VVSETTGKPYTVDNFGRLFREITTAAGLPAELQYRDLRRTAVVRLAEAGCSGPEIAAITGHSLRTATQILETYLTRNTTMARNAIARSRSTGSERSWKDSRSVGRESWKDWRRSADLNRGPTDRKCFGSAPIFPYRPRASLTGRGSVQRVMLRTPLVTVTSSGATIRAVSCLHTQRHIYHC
jgi:hypothetical protein